MEKTPGKNCTLKKKFMIFKATIFQGSKVGRRRQIFKAPGQKFEGEALLEKEQTSAKFKSSVKFEQV